MAIHSTTIRPVLTLSVIAATLGGVGLCAPSAQAATKPASANTGSTPIVARVTYYSSTNVRTSAAPSSRIAAKVGAGTPIQGTLLPGGWIRVTSPKNLAGKYVSDTVLKPANVVPTSPTTTKPTPPATTGATTMYTYESSTTIRSARTTTSRVAGRLTGGQAVTGTVENGWLRIATPSALAGKYISLTVLSRVAPPTSSQCLDPQAQVSDANGYVLCASFHGVKVRTVRKALGQRIDWTVDGGTLDSATVAMIKRVQAQHGLAATGEVDRATYAVLVPAGNFDVDGWQNPSRVDASATRTQRVDAMITWAEAQKGKPYVWGGTGAPGAARDIDGYDCSGLAIQAVRAGGLNPRQVSNFKDVRPASNLSSQMWQDTTDFARVTPGLVSYARYQSYLAQGVIKRGDLIFYAHSAADSSVGHVSIYEGNNKIVNAVESGVANNTASQRYVYSYFGASRPFN